jgi:hypothetical protein
MPLAPPIDAIQQPAVGIYGLPVGASAGAMVLLTAAQIRAHAALGTLATQDGTFSGTSSGTNTGDQSLAAYLTSAGAASTYLPLAGGTLTGDLTLSSGRQLIGTESKISLSSGGGGQLAGYVSTTPVFSVSIADGFRVNHSLSIGWANFGTGLDAVPDLRLYRGGAGILAQRNSTNAQISTIEKTYTSATSREYIQSGWNATDSAYDVGVSYQGSAGGSLQAVRIGNRTAAGVFAGLTVATSGAITASDDITLAFNKRLFLSNGATTGNYLISGSTAVLVSNAVPQAGWNSTGFYARQIYLDYVNEDVLLARHSTGPALNVQAAGGLRVLNLTGSADAALTCGAITASGGVTSVANDFYVSDSGTYYFSNVTRNRGMLISSGGGGRIGFKAGGTEWLQISDAGAITASGTIITRNGTSPTSIQITNTYTSSTSFGLLDIRANAAQTAYEISSFLGSAGGANLPINIGHRDSAGTFKSALSVAAGTQSTLLTKDSNYITQTRQLSSGRMGFRVTTGGTDVCFARYNDAGIIAELGSGYASGSTEIWAGNAARISIASTGSITFSGLIKPQQATTAAAPAYVLGAIYFDTTLNKLRIGGATAWETVTSV